MKTHVPLPLAKCAFDDPGTRQLWSKAFRTTLTNLLVRAAIWAGLLITATVVPDEGANQNITGAASFFSMIVAFLLIRPAIKLRWLLVVSRVLKSGPWRSATAVRRSDVKNAHGTAVELRLTDEPPSREADPVVAARTWRRRLPWSDELGQEAWVVLDDPRLPGLLAQPGGFGPMTLHRVS